MSSSPDPENDPTAPPARPAVTGDLPRIPLPSRPPKPSPPTTAEATGPEGPGEALAPPPSLSGNPILAERSSPASTDEPAKPAKPDQPVEEPIDPKDLQAAVGQLADVSFVLFGQLVGRADARARSLPEVDSKWVPTDEERLFVAEPAARIAKRHIKAPRQALDVIDGTLIAAGVAGFTVRGLTGVTPLDKAKEP